jgi:16S rRNA (guanine966-N2)-methyltransferase
VRRANGLSVLKDLAGSNQDLVFLDPPFDAGLFDKAVAAALAALGPQGLLYVEAPAPWSVSQAAERGLELQRHTRAGAVHAHLLGRLAAPSP